jgi:uncharacterized membrane protein
MVPLRDLYLPGSGKCWKITQFLHIADGMLMNKFAVNHMRFLASVGAGIAAFPFMPSTWALLPRVLLSWDCGVALFLVLIYVWMKSLSAEQICSRFVEEDESAPVILSVVIVAALLSLVAIVAQLADAGQGPAGARAIHYALAAATVVLSWLLVPTIFALHYADQFYSAPAHDRPLDFPATPMPVFWDFAYFSFTIAAACQTSDVGTRGSAVRRTVLAHTVISFLFNAAILGFAINVSAGLFSSR